MFLFDYARSASGVLILRQISRFENVVFFLLVFFPPGAHLSSSALSGSSSWVSFELDVSGVAAVGTPTWAVCLGAAHDPNPTTQVPLLRTAIRSRAAQPLSPEVLQPAGLPAGEQVRQPAGLAGLAQGEGLLPRAGQPPAGQGLATGPSGVLAEAASEVSRLTRSLPAASPDSTSR